MTFADEADVPGGVPGLAVRPGLTARRRRRHALACPVILVRLLLFLALATRSPSSGLLYLFKRDRRYLRFIGQVAKYTILLLVGVMLFLAFERLVILL